jgi:hypothetical protein
MVVQREYGASMNEPCTILIKLGARYTAMQVASVRATSRVLRWDRARHPGKVPKSDEVAAT